MKKVIKRIPLLIVMVLSTMLSHPLSTCAVSANAESNTPSTLSQYSSYDYVIDKYDINMVVNENNTFDITENITAYFNTAKHGIYRTIPLRNTITRLDGSTSTNKAKVSNLSVNDKYSTSKESGNYVIKIGSSDSTVVGEKSYTIKYTYNIGKDPSKDYDELYYNLIGNNWDTVIGNITFSITMPKDFDSSKLGFSSGTAGSTDNSKIQYTVTDNKIDGSYNGILGKREALTVRCELPEGYFVGAGFDNSPMLYAMIIASVLFLIISLLMSFVFGRSKDSSNQVVETVEFYPPDGINSLDSGFLYRGRARTNDVNSLLIYLANKGYIKISDSNEKSKNFKIIKLKEYDGDDINEKIFLDGLFSKTGKNEVGFKDLYDKFYHTISKIASNVNSKENIAKIFKKSALVKSALIVLMIVLTYGIVTLLPIIDYDNNFAVWWMPLIPIIGFLFIIGFFIEKKLSRFIIGIILFIVPWLLFVLPVLVQDRTYLIGHTVGLVCMVGMAVCLKLLPKRTPYGNEILGKLKGFKTFLTTAEKDKLEAMVMENPSYFYDILPYAYVLGVSNKWIKKFESISMKAPTWYDSPTAFDVLSFNYFMNTTMRSLQSKNTSSSSSVGSSGGGFSGGGSGGGGGGSW